MTTDHMGTDQEQTASGTDSGQMSVKAAQTLLRKTLEQLADTSTLSPFEIIRRRRGWSSEAIRAAEQGTSELLPDLDSAAELLAEAIAAGTAITILTDYDMDGVSAGVLAYAGLAELGAQINLVVPHYEGPREITADKVDQAFAQFPDTGLIISCDVGINSNEGIDRAHERGAKFIVTDHHHQEVEHCHADAVVDPNRTGCTYPEPDICGAQVMMHLLRHYVSRHDPGRAEALIPLTAFAGIGALADMMPLTGQSRHLIRQTVALLSLAVPHVPVYTGKDATRDDNPIRRYQIGQWNLEDPSAIDPDTATISGLVHSDHHDRRYVEALRGLALLMTGLILGGKVRSIDDIDPSFMGFTLTPMFNATRRIGGDMADAFLVLAPQAVAASRPDHTVLPESSHECDALRLEAVARLIEGNEHRKELTRQAMEEIADAEQPYAPYIWFSPARAGILGLLASNLQQQNQVPTIVLNPETLSGSARSPEAINILGLVNGLGDARLYAAGHHHACGVRISETTALDKLIAAIDTAVSALPEITPGQAHADLHLVDLASLNELGVPETTELMNNTPDMVLPPMTELVWLADQLRSLGPFGRGFAEPSIDITFQPAHSTLSLMSPVTDADGHPIEDPEGPEDYKHLKIVTPNKMTLVWWNATEHYQQIADAQMVTARVSLSTNLFMGQHQPQGIITEITAI